MFNVLNPEGAVQLYMKLRSFTEFFTGEDWDAYRTNPTPAPKYHISKDLEDFYIERDHFARKSILVRLQEEGKIKNKKRVRGVDF